MALHTVRMVFPSAGKYDTKIYGLMETTAWLDEEKGVIPAGQMRVILEAIEWVRWQKSLFGEPWEGESCKSFEVVEPGKWRLLEPPESHIEIVVK